MPMSVLQRDRHEFADIQSTTNTWTTAGSTGVQLWDSVAEVQKGQL